VSKKKKKNGNLNSIFQHGADEPIYEWLLNVFIYLFIYLLLIAWMNVCLQIVIIRPGTILQTPLPLPNPGVCAH
jgi:hypothetical protein